jgi:hypothetical protein
MSQKLEDMFGNAFGVGDLVVFTTNSRDSGLSFGKVDDIVTKTGTYRNGFTWTESKVRIRHSQLDGTLKTVRPDSEILVRPSTINYSKSKFLTIA